MNYLKSILAIMAFVFAIGAAFATYTNNVPVFYTTAYTLASGCSGTDYTITVPSNSSLCGFSGNTNCKISPVGTNVDAYRVNGAGVCAILTYAQK